ncbi:MAG: sigma-70 family RNA polymerase sigma factor [Bacteroidales bacterium]|nr:sigma-70 family RNA polymerase sigma factor [Bacteroidales bacterium]
MRKCGFVNLTRKLYLSPASEKKRMTSEHSNKELIRGLRRGDSFVFDEIFKKYNRKIYSISISFLKSRLDAEGVVQEVFLNLWRKRADLKDELNFDSYLFTITYNTIRKRFQKLAAEKKYTEEYVRSIPIDDNSTDSEIEYRNLLELAENKINLLPPQQKKVYLLSVREGNSAEEISKMLGISKRTAENHLHRAKDYLRKALSDDRLITLLFIYLFI